MQTQNNNHPFITSHLFHAPLSRVWSVWTEEEHLQHWSGLNGTAVTPLRMELWPGGVFHHILTTPDGERMWHKWTYVEIIPEERLVAITAFSDAHGGITNHPFKEGWPQETLSVVEFRRWGKDTLVTIECSPYRASEEESALFDASRTEMTQEWLGRFNRLDDYLEQLK
jgi:uncharacterized protein YndB with AHSA1/START domain